MSHRYRLAGRTLFPVDENNVGIRFDTAYQGRYFEPYYIILRVSPKGRSAGLHVHRHTVPYFIPIEKLAADLLNKSIGVCLSPFSSPSLRIMM